MSFQEVSLSSVAYLLPERILTMIEVLCSLAFGHTCGFFADENAASVCLHDGGCLYVPCQHASAPMLVVELVHARVLVKGEGAKEPYEKRRSHKKKKH